MRKQQYGGLFAYAFYRVEFGYQLGTGTAVTVVGYTETVGLITHVLHNFQGLRILVDIQRDAIAREVYLLKALCDTDHGYCSAQPY